MRILKHQYTLSEKKVYLKKSTDNVRLKLQRYKNIDNISEGN